METRRNDTMLGVPLEPLVREGALSPEQRSALLGGTPWRIVQEHHVDDARAVNRALQRDASRGVQAFVWCPMRRSTGRC